MSLVINAFTVSWGIVGMTVSNQRLLRETESRLITSIVCQHQLRLYRHVARYPETDPVSRLFLKEIIQSGGGQGGAHKVCGWGKLMLPTGSYLVWEGGLHGVIGRAGIRGLARRCASQCMPPMMIECIIYLFLLLPGISFTH